MRIIHLLLPALLLLATTTLFSQTPNNLQTPTSINEDGGLPDASAILDLDSDSLGLLVPRMTSALRMAISSPATGLLVYDTDTGSFWFHNGTGWSDLSAPSGTADADGDTRVQVEETADEDFIRFDVRGTEAMVIDTSGRVGIGTGTPDALLDIEGGALLAQGTTGSTPVSGAGTRLMWVPEKAAFRAGEVSGTQWDADNIGLSSAVVGGIDNKATGSSSFTGGGQSNTAWGSDSFVGGGFDNTTSGSYSFAGGGINNTAGNINAFVCGQNNSAFGYSSFVGGGFENIASGTDSFVGGGQDNTASGPGSFAGGGVGSTASGTDSFVGGGQELLAKSYAEAVFGTFNTDYTPNSTNDIDAGDRLFVIGNGTGPSDRSNAVTVLKNGRVGIGTDMPDAPLNVMGITGETFVFNVANDAGTNRFTVRNNGQVGIGLTDPGVPLGVQSLTAGDNIPVIKVRKANCGGPCGQDEPTQGLHLQNTNNTTGNTIGIGLADNNQDLNPSAWIGAKLTDKVDHYADLEFKTQGTDGLNTRLTIRSNGRVGIGRNPTTNPLEVEGNASKSTAGDWLANSDARLKTNIRPLDSEEILRKMLSLQGITYEWDDDKTGSERPEGAHYGFTAQNIQLVFPELVTEDNLGYLQTAYGTYDAMTVEAMRAQQNQIEELKTEVTALQSQLSEMDELKSRMALLETALLQLTSSQEETGED